jgi:hypothetical protein
VKHPHRRGHLGDLVLLADALSVADDASASAAFDVAWKYALFARGGGGVGPFLPGWSAHGYLALERVPLRRSVGWPARAAYRLGLLAVLLLVSPHVGRIARMVPG